MIRSRIQNCVNCELCKKMSISPIATEFFGTKPKVLIISGAKPTDLADFSQEVISGAERKILVDLFYKLKVEFAITYLVKCKPDPNFKKEHYKECVKWIDKEIELIKPKIIIGLGADVKKHTRCDLCLSAPSISLNNKKSISQIEKLVSV